MNRIKSLVVFFTLFLGYQTRAQELSCQISVDYSQIQGTTNKQIFEQLKQAAFEFMNNTKWTNDIFTTVEKIECSILFIIKEVPSTDTYKGSMQITSRRPVYKSSYYTQVLNIEDEDMQFTYQQFTQLQFNINSFHDNLTSLLQYYAYVIIAADYDTFSPLGGTQYWQKAQLIVQNAQNASEPGWRQSQTTKGEKNRYYLVDNTLQPVFKGIRDCMYDYCKNGLDKMNEGPDDARASILRSLDLLLPVYRTRPASFNMQVFFNARRDELVNIFKGASPEEKTKVIDLLMIIDPAGTTKYSKIQG